MQNQNLRRIESLLIRAWRIYLRPPKESRIFLEVAKLPVLTDKVLTVSAASEPKQVAVDLKRRQALVSCMKGQKLQFFLYESGLRLVDEIDFPEQCVEVTVAEDLALVTTTNFARPVDNVRGVKLQNHLWTIDLDTRKIMGKCETGGNWSKVVKVHPNGRIALVSNWHSHNVSIINIENPANPYLVKQLPAGESPRGIAFSHDGETALITGFYSSNIIEIGITASGDLEIVNIGKRFDHPNYSGNLRDILPDPNNSDLFWISNLGRNLVLCYSLSNRQFLQSISVGKSPNSLAFDENGRLLVSCRGSNAVLVVDTGLFTAIGRSSETSQKPTGLAAIPKGFLSTSFSNNKLEMYSFS